MPTGHLVAHADGPLGRHVNLHHLQNAGTQFIPPLHAIEPTLAGVDRLIHCGPHRLVELIDLGFPLRRPHVEFIWLEGCGTVGDHLVFLIANQRTAVGASQRLLKNFLHLGDHGAEGLGNLEVSFVLSFFQLLLKFAAFVFRQAHAPGKFLGSDHDPLDTGGNLQRIILHILACPAEDGMQQFFLWRQLSLALGRDLTHKDVAGTDVGSDPHDARLVEIVQSPFAHIGDVAGELLATELGIADLDVVFLDVDRGVDVILHQLFADNDGVLEIETIPGHKADEYIATQSQFALVDAGTVSKHLVLLDLLAELHDRLLVLAGSFVETDILAKLVNIGSAAT